MDPTMRATHEQLKPLFLLLPASAPQDTRPTIASEALTKALNSARTIEDVYRLMRVNHDLDTQGVSEQVIAKILLLPTSAPQDNSASAWLQGLNLNGVKPTPGQISYPQIPGPKDKPKILMQGPKSYNNN